MSFEMFNFGRKKVLPERDEELISKIVASEGQPETIVNQEAPKPKELDPGVPTYSPINEPRPLAEPGHIEPDMRPERTYPEAPPKTM